jgi:hypothetical protein
MVYAARFLLNCCSVSRIWGKRFKGTIDNWDDAEGITQLVIRLGLDNDQNNLPRCRR